MKRELEQFLWDRCPLIMQIEVRRGASFYWPRDVINHMVDTGMIQSPKQAWATLEKWSRKDAYNYGVTLDLGWREQETMP